MSNENSKLKLKKSGGNFDFEDLRTDENGKFINENTKIEIDKDNKIVTFTNSYPDGEMQRICIKLRKKKDK